MENCTEKCKTVVFAIYLCQIEVYTEIKNFGGTNERKNFKAR